jgi:hypothetical protein
VISGKSSDGNCELGPILDTCDRASLVKPNDDTWAKGTADSCLGNDVSESRARALDEGAECPYSEGESEVETAE